MSAKCVFMRNIKTRRKRYDACDELCKLNTMDQTTKLENQNANQRSVCILERRSDGAGER